MTLIKAISDLKEQAEKKGEVEDILMSLDVLQKQIKDEKALKKIENLKGSMKVTYSNFSENINDFHKSVIINLQTQKVLYNRIIIGMPMEE